MKKSEYFLTKNRFLVLIFNVFDWCHAPLKVLIFNLLMSYISATYDHAALQATACPYCMKDKHYTSTALHVWFPFKSTSQCYVHTCMMTQPVTWWRLYEHTLLWIPMSGSLHELNIIFALSNFNIFDFTLQVKLIFPLVNLDVNSPWDNVPFFPNLLKACCHSINN